jgi:hypothetical protein
MSDPLVLIAGGAAVLAVGFFVAGSVAFGRKHPVPHVVTLLLGTVLVLAAALAGTVSVATQGYRALTREELVATVQVMPTGSGRFRATFYDRAGRGTVFDLRGDQLYVDARILKWKPIVNIVGLHTAYELDRIGGRYADLRAERDSSRTVFSLAEDKPVDMFRLRERWAFLGPIVDAEYGSGTFHAVDRPARLDVYVSTSGLLIRVRERS